MVGSNTEAGLSVTYDDATGKLNFNVSDPTITFAGGDVSGSFTMTNLGSVNNIVLTVANDSHTHDGRYYTETEADAKFLLNTTDTLSGNLTVTGALYVGANGGGDGTINFYDDNSDTWRTLRWDDSANTFALEDNGGTVRTIIHSGTIGSQSVSSATTAGTCTGNAATASQVYSTQRDTAATYYLAFVDGTASGNKSVSHDDQISVNPSTNTISCTNFAGTATSAKYADLAENYLADAVYEVGTVIAVGGTAEVTAANTTNEHSVLGVVSDKPAYLMNSELVDGTTVALKGRVPVRVIGKVKKGDRLAPSMESGLATVKNQKDAWSFAIALHDAEGTPDQPGIVEAVIL